MQYNYNAVSPLKHWFFLKGKKGNFILRLCDFGVTLPYGRAFLKHQVQKKKKISFLHDLSAQVQIAVLSALAVLKVFYPS